MSYKFNEINLEKGMYSQKGKSFTQVLESLDPSENYKGTPYEGMDAFQRQLGRFDIRVKGPGSDRVEKFFSTSASTVLFPEYVSRSVKTGMEENDVLSSIVASSTNIDSMSYRSVYSTATDSDKELITTSESGSLPTTEIKTSDNLVKLKKRGRLLLASYEAIRFQKLDMFSVMLRQIGNHIAQTRLSDAISVLVAGDGNDNAAQILSVGEDPIGGTAGSLDYETLLNFWNSFEPYNMNTLLVAPDVLLKILKCSQFQNPLAGLNFMGSGQTGTPLGAKLLKTAVLPEGYAIGLDRNYALEMVTAGDVSVEYDRLIDKQLERAAISSIGGFAKIYTDASKMLNVG